MLLQGVFREVEDLVGLVAVVVYVLLGAPYASQALAVGDAAKSKGAVPGQRMEERVAWVAPILHVVADHLQHGGDYIGLVREPFYSFAALEAAWRVDQEGYPQALLVDGVAVEIAAVLAEALPVVAVDDEDRLLVQAHLLVLVYEVLEEVVQHAHAVVVAVDQAVVGEEFVTVAVRDALIVVVPGAGKILGHKGLVLVLFQPRSARPKNNDVLVADVVCNREAPLIHYLRWVVLLVAQIRRDDSILVHYLAGRLEKDSVVALLFEKVGHAPGGDAPRLELRAVKEWRLDPPVDRGGGLFRARDDHVGGFDEKAFSR